MKLAPFLNISSNKSKKFSENVNHLQTIRHRLALRQRRTVVKLATVPENGKGKRNIIKHQQLQYAIRHLLT